MGCAYRSNENGRNDVFVESFPVPGKRFPISTTGGGEPTWRADGREVFYRSPDDKIMAVDVNAVRTTLEVGVPHALFQIRPSEDITAPIRNSYAVTSDGQKFLVVTAAEQPDAAIEVVSNWLAGLKR